MKVMARLELGNVIAKRQLHYSHPDHTSRRVEVLLGSPVQSTRGGEWYCSWQIVGIGSEEVRAAYGVDAFQCLQLVMKMIGATLSALTDDGSRLSWKDNQFGDFGFPME
jgi:hypothetical protein